MEIRIATMADKEQVLHLLDEFSSYLKAKDKPSEVGKEIFDEIISRHDTKIFIAEENGKAIGVATLYLLPNIRHGWHRGHIEDFFVIPVMRGQKVGTQIFNAIKNYCRENNVTVIKLDSGNDLPEAHLFYEKLGGKSTERFFRFNII